MVNCSQSKWTILLYFNGNNELEPEMWNAKALAASVDAGVNIRVVLQLGREDRRLARLMRPSDGIPLEAARWLGVRRYQLARGKPVLVQQLDKVNMADPRQLCDFLSWGMQAYPADHYMLVLSGHGYQYVGIMTDYSQEKPYILGIPEMAASLRLVGQRLSKEIDILVLDSCYCNCIEVLYEIGGEGCCTRAVITHAGQAPLGGMPYSQLISVMRENVYGNRPMDACRQIVEAIPANLVAYRLDPTHIARVKQLFSDLAAMYLDSGQGSGPPLSRLVNTPHRSDPWFGVAAELQHCLESLITCCKATDEHAEPITVAASLLDDPYRVRLYRRLAFSQSNLWFEMLQGKAGTTYTPPAPSAHHELLPLALDRRVVRSNLASMNPALNESQIDSLLDELLRHKGWDI
jgi:hypothetical protein